MTTKTHHTGIIIAIIILFATIYGILFLLKSHDFLNDEKFIDIVFTSIPNIILAIITISYVILTRELVLANKEMADIQKEPRLVAYLEPENHYGRLIIENVGKGIATNIHLTIEGNNVPIYSSDAGTPKLDQQKTITDFIFVKDGIPVLGPEKKFHTSPLWYFTNLKHEVKTGNIKPESLKFKIVMTCQDSEKNIKQFEPDEINLGLYLDL
jgi:hypothetical protein